MNRTELEACIKFAEDHIAFVRSVIAELPADPEAVKEWPQAGDDCFSIDCNGGIFESIWLLDGVGATGLRARIGNLFQTQALARRHVEALKVQAELRAMPGRCAAPDSKESRWGICAISGISMLVDCWNETQTVALAGVWFATKEAAEHALDTIGQDRLRIYLDDFLQVPMEVCDETTR